MLADYVLFQIPHPMVHTTNARHSFFKSNPRKLYVSELVHSPDQISSTFNPKIEENCDKHLWVKVNIEQCDFYGINCLAAQLGKPIVINYSNR